MNAHPDDHDHDPTDAALPALDLDSMMSGLTSGGLGGLLEQAQQMMASMSHAADTEVEGRSGGGAVTVRVNGRFAFQSVTIDPAVVDSGEVDLLEDLVLAALRDAASQVANLSPGLGAMPGLDGLFGGQ